MEALQKLYNDYRETAAEVKRKAPLFAELFSTAGSASRHPCHEQFYESVEQWFSGFAAGQPSGEEAVAVCGFLLNAPLGKREESCYWFMYVCINFIDKLIPFMDEAACGQVAQQLAALYKKRERMPSQEAVFKNLCKKAGLDSRKLK